MHILIIMRTTIDIADDLRERLLIEAHRSGRRGYSEIVEEALRLYFSRFSDNNGRADIVKKLYGSEKYVSNMKEAETRENWRTGR